MGMTCDTLPEVDGCSSGLEVKNIHPGFRISSVITDASTGYIPDDRNALKTVRGL